MQFLEINCYFWSIYIAFIWVNIQVHKDHHQSTVNRECIESRQDGIGVGIYAPKNITLTEGRLAIGHPNHLFGGPPSSLYLHPSAKVKKSGHMAITPRIYALQMLHQIGQLVKTEYHHFHLPVVPRLAIIAIGLRKAKLGRPYCQSKAGHKLFHRINSITSQHKT